MSQRKTLIRRGSIRIIYAEIGKGDLPVVMKPDLQLAPTVWHDFYAVTGFAPGTDVVFCNRSSTRIVLFEGSQPDPNTLHGAEIQPGAWGRVRGQSAWLKGNASVLIGGLQEYQP